MAHQRIGILGGTFNPVHLGHLAASEEVRARLRLDRVLFVPAAVPPHKVDADLASAGDRLEMVRLAIADRPWFALSDIEVTRGGTSYTIDTVRSLRSSHPAASLFFITGVDSFLEIKTWHLWDQLLATCTFVVLSRPGSLFSDLRRLDFMRPVDRELADLDAGAMSEAVIRTDFGETYLEAGFTSAISSTEVRRRLREGLSVKYLLPDAVEQYIITNGLYG
jgi:nicotinate-nucleotide adenylyltransferase